MHSYKRRLHTYRRRKSPLSVIINLIIFLCLICSTIAYAEKQSFHPKESEGPIIGIDLGTTYSCLAVFENGSTKVIPNEQGNRITPSVVAFTDVNERLVGDAAKNQATTNPENTVYDVKRLIGRDFNDPSVQADKKLVPFNIVSDSLGKPRISIKHNTGERVYSPEEISGLILAKMKSIAESYLGREISRAVVTVPAYFNQAQREATKDAGRIAGLTVERIINEPTAAAIAYGLDQDGGVEDKNVLVYDLGGGTFDVTLLNLDEGVFDVLSSEGDTHLGGEDFDQRVMKHFVNVMKKKSGIDISNEKKSLQKLRKEVERVKRALSSQKQARLEIEDIVPGYDLQETLTRARFEELNNDLFKRTLKPVKSVLERAGLEKSDVDHIVLVGGSTRIPRVQELLSDFFDGRQLSKKIDPDEAVAFGAGVQGSILGGHSGEYADVILLDKTSLSLGIETVGGVFVPVVKRDTSIPTKKSKTFSTNQDSQSTVVIDVYEGERAMTKDNHPLGKFELSGIPPAARGVPQIEVTFQVDSNGILEVSAVDKGTGKSETITITSEKGRLSEAEIQRMIHEAEVYADEDRGVKERTDAKNGLESYLYHLKNSLEDDNLADLLLQEEKQELLELIDEKLEWLEEQVEHSKSDLDDHRREVEQVANPLMRQIYDHITPGSRDEEYYDSDL